MKLKLIVAGVALALSSTSFALTKDLGVLDANGSSFGTSFSRIFGWGSALGDFTDHYTFTLTGASTAQGGAAVSMEWGSLDLDLNSVSLSGGTLDAKQTDTSPESFSFSNLGAGTYTLDIAGILKNVGGPIGYAHYSGSIQSVASAAPEPEALAMVLAGLSAVGLMGRRRR